MNTHNLCLKTTNQFEQEEPLSEKESFLNDVLHGLTQSPKALPCKYFYDKRGSELFEAICQTPEYYVTRTETQLLQNIAPDIAQHLGADCLLLEFGSGAGEKIRILLDHIRSPSAYVPMDISKEILLRSSQELAESYPKLNIRPWVGDYTQDLSHSLSESLLTPLPSSSNPLVDSLKGTNHSIRPISKRVVFFPGSTISNFDQQEAADFLKNVCNWLGKNGVLLIGVDLIKSTSTLDKAYNDTAGMTAAFNLNLIQRMASELDTDISPDNFSHLAFFNQEKSRIEMHLVSKKTTTYQLAGESIAFEKNERIHTENSYKYSVESFQSMAKECGFSSDHVWVDEDALFSFHYLTTL